MTFSHAVVMTSSLSVRPARGRSRAQHSVTYRPGIRCMQSYTAQVPHSGVSQAPISGVSQAPLSGIFSGGPSQASLSCPFQLPLSGVSQVPLSGAHPRCLSNVSQVLA
ncbi:unnamed protein product [Closterium sp. NIES-65]|nr:unnamed protein product [Closterium sp. NIES-65]